MITAQQTRPARVMAALALSVILAACGGGGGGGSSDGGNGGGVGRQPTPPASNPEPPASNPQPPASNPEPPASNPTPPVQPNPVPSGYTSITKLTQQAVAGFKYFVQTVKSLMTDEVIITLPANSDIVVGDTIDVRGDTNIPWKIAQNPGQTIGTRALQDGVEPGLVFTSQQDTTPQNWWFIASSANGEKLAAVANNSGGFTQPGAPSTGAVWTSTDGGNTWTERTAPKPLPWASIASSADGTKLAAVGIDSNIWTSADSGLTWQPRESNRFWVSVTISADGNHIAAVVLEADNIGIGKPAGAGRIYTWEQTGNLDFGAGSWAVSGDVLDWRSIASSADGSKLVAVAYTDESSAGPRPLRSLYTSTDFGKTWIASTQQFTSAYRVASSQDGSRLVMAERFGKVYTSSNSGATWLTSSTLDGGFYSVASSYDGKTLMAVAPNNSTFGGVTPNDGKLRVSTDYGANWSEGGVVALWRGAAMSADGNRLVAAVNNGLIYRSLSNRTTLGTAGSITGSQANDLTLRYLGDGLFEATSNAGPAYTVR